MVSNFTPAQTAMLWSWRLLLAALVSFLGMFVLGALTHNDYIFLAGLAITAALAVLGTVMRLLGTVQLRLLELLILVAWLGNLIGWSIRGVLALPHEFDAGTRFLFSVLAVGTALLWTGGGASIGLRLAQALAYETPLQRLKLLATGMFVPLAVTSVFAGIAIVLLNLGGPDFRIAPSIFSGFALIVAGVLFIVYVFKLAEKARRPMQSSDV